MPLVHEPFNEHVWSGLRLPRRNVDLLRNARAPNTITGLFIFSEVLLDKAYMVPKHHHRWGKVHTHGQRRLADEAPS